MESMRKITFMLMVYFTCLPSYSAANSIEFRLGLVEPRADMKYEATMVDGVRLYVSTVAELDGSHIDKVEVGKRVEYEGKPGTDSLKKIDIHYVLMSMTDSGKQKLADLSEKYIGKYLVIFMNRKPIVAPRIQSVIPDGKVWISNLESEQAAKELASQLK